MKGKYIMTDTQFNKEYIINMLHEKVCKVVFTKSNGDTRVMHATLKSDLLPQKEQKDIKEETKQRKENPNVLAVFDVDASGWRSFRWDSLKDFSTEYNV